jgi:hypothetical protein
MRVLFYQPSHTKHDRRRRVSFLKWIACLTLWGCCLTAESSAAPMTWLYAGSIASSPDQSVVPVGTPVSFTLTVDPEANFLVNAPGYPPWAGGYFATLQVDFSGLHYDGFGAFEVNEDVANNQPAPGLVLFRHLGWSGPNLFGRTARCQIPLCVDFLSQRADPTSPALPLLPLDPFRFAIPFEGSPFESRLFLSVSGHDPQLVPETRPVVLVATGLLVLTFVRRRGLSRT